jgi:hypothetical protein
MATLRYIAGQQIDGADKYHLYLVINEEDKEKERVETRDVLQGFNHMGIMIDGKVKEEQRNYYFKSMDRWFGKPIRYLTEEGVKLGFRITGYVDIVGVGGFITKRGFDVICYVEPELENTNVDVEVADGIASEANAYYLQVKIEKESDWRLIPIFENNGDYEHVYFNSKENGYVTIHHVAIAESYWHTDYIYIPSLTDNIVPYGETNPVCVGRFDLSTDLGYDKLSFYNKNLKFLGGAKVSYISVDAGYENVEYLTKDQVQAIAIDVTGITDTTNEDYPRFVVFCSRKSGDPADRVSVGNVYFPLFETSVTYNIGDGDKLAVTADSSSDHYTESALSNVVTYTINT